MAERARVCVKSGITTNKSGEEYLIRELQNTNKHANSWAKSSVLWAGPHPLTYRVSWMSVLSEFGPEIGTEFINMITAQRAYQASAKVITTTDDMMTALMNTKR